MIWVGSDDPRLGAAARDLLVTADEVLVSAATWWELTIKEAHGKVHSVPQIAAVAAGNGLRDLPIQPRHAMAIGAIDLPHQDPFDRMLAAQARVEKAIFLTADRQILSAGLPGVVDARA